MNNIYKNTITVFLLAMVCLGCNDDYLEKYPTTEISESNFFKSDSDLMLYTNGYYEMLNPGHSLGYGRDYVSDDIETANNELSTIEEGRVIPATTLGGDEWNWNELRSINYFLENCQKEGAEIPLETINHYIGITRFFRAWFYFKKVKQFGDVPWINKVLKEGDEELMSARDDRNIVMDSVMADLNYAIENITLESGHNHVNKNTALAFKSRVALFEGTWLKYHEKDFSRANNLLQQAAQAAQEVIDSGDYSIYSTGDAQKDYLELFAAEEGNSAEGILVRTYVVGKGEGHSSNYIFTDYNQGRRQATKSLINSFLMADGSYFTSTPNYQVMPYNKEVLSRDPRLSQIIRTPGYTRIDDDLKLLPDLNYAANGYQIIKYVTDRSSDSYVANTNDYIIIRYAEVLLNFAEAKAELGEISQSDLDMTINKIRDRVNVPSLITTVSVDPLQQELYPNITDPLLLEIRRERRTELCFEGFRYDDIRRWKVGDLIRSNYKGMYIDAIGVPFDMDNDGIDDAIVLNSENDFEESTMGTLQRIVLEEGSPNAGGGISLSEGNKGNIIIHNTPRPAFQDYEYLYPIPTPELILNPELEQNRGY